MAAPRPGKAARAGRTLLPPLKNAVEIHWKVFPARRAGRCSMSNTSPKFVDHGYSGSQTHPCSHRAMAICARVLGSAPNLCWSRPP